jgi:hypothetical protein
MLQELKQPPPKLLTAMPSALLSTLSRKIVRSRSRISFQERGIDILHDNSLTQLGKSEESDLKLSLNRQAVKEQRLAQSCSRGLQPRNMPTVIIGTFAIVR